MPYRQLPSTDITRTQAIHAAAKKWNGAPATAKLISPDTAAALSTLAPKWDKEITERADALGTQTAATSRLITLAAGLRLTVSHFFQVYQFGVARHIFSPSGRAVYELSVNEENAPHTESESNLLLWADRIVKGDARRVTQFGEPAMAMPSAADVGAALNAYQTQLALQTEAKDALEAEQSDVTALRADADQVIKDVWDEVEFALRQLEAPTLRRRAREWGIFYALRPGEPEEPATEPTVPN